MTLPNFASGECTPFTAPAPISVTYTVGDPAILGSIPAFNFPVTCLLFPTESFEVAEIAAGDHAVSVDSDARTYRISMHDTLYTGLTRTYNIWGYINCPTPCTQS